MVEEKNEDANLRAKDVEEVVRRALSTDDEIYEMYVAFNDRISRFMEKEQAMMQDRDPDYSDYESIEVDFTVSHEQFILPADTTQFDVKEHYKLIDEWYENKKSELYNEILENTHFHGLYSTLWIELNSMLSEKYLKEKNAYSIENHKLLTEELPITLESLFMC